MNNNEYISLFQFFNDQGDRWKERLWGILTWAYTISGGVLAFILTKWTRLGDNVATEGLITNPGPALAASLFGLLFIAFLLFMIYEYGRHIQACWDRTDFIKDSCPDLWDIWYASKIGVQYSLFDREEEVVPDRNNAVAKIKAQTDVDTHSNFKARLEKIALKYKHKRLPKLAKQLMLLTAIPALTFLVLVVLALAQL